MGSTVSKIKSKASRVVSKIPFFNSESDDEDDFKIVSRAEWHARVPKWRENLQYPALSVTTVYTETEPCKSPEQCTRAVQDLQARHMDLDHLPDIEYSFLIGGDGRIYEGRGWHTKSDRSTLIKCVDPEYPPPPVVLNKDSLRFSPDRRLVIAFIGDSKKSPATQEMESKARELVQRGIGYFYIYSGDDDDDAKADDFLKEVRTRMKKEEEEEEEDRESSDSDIGH